MANDLLSSWRLSLLTSLILLFLGLCLCDLPSPKKLDLSTASWTFSSANGTYRGIAVVPGDIYGDLHRNNLIDEPLFGDNDRKLRWISESDWIYRCDFYLGKEWNKYYAFVLDLLGLDTIANVSINDVRILSTNNQFQRYTVQVKNLKNGWNHLIIEFESSVRYAKKKADKYKEDYGYIIPPKCPPFVFHGQCHANYIRKIQSSFSWDWGPSFPGVGIWRPIYLIATNTVVVEEVNAVVTKVNQSFMVSVGIHVYGAINIDNVMFTYSIAALKINESKSVTIYSGFKNRVEYDIEVPASKVSLWWPSGYGDQPLYSLKVRVRIGEDVISSKSLRIGFRSIELDESLIYPNDTAAGRNFFFKVNNVPIFLKGSNWIPVSMFPARNHSSRLRFLLDSAYNANMNTIRVWGGGHYENDEFLEYADENGILVMHDLMFACALYPVDSEFLANVAQEVEYQIRTLMHHPSILVWIGNNENEVGIERRWWTEMEYRPPLMQNDYVKLYNNTIRPIVEGLDRSRPFLLSSPGNGMSLEGKDGIAPNASSEKYGDIHFYKDFSNLWSVKTYPIPRCATEYGVQSLPRRETMLHYMNETEWTYFSQSMMNRQHRPGGNLELLMMIYSHFPLPRANVMNRIKEIPKQAGFLGRFTYFTQMHQAIAYQIQTEHYRRWRGRLQSSGLGNTMCALYWQLNDVWAAPSWSSIDYDLSWKPVQYFARRFFDTVIISLFVEDDQLKVFVVSDRTSPLLNITVMVDQLAWTNEFEPVVSYHKLVDIQPLSSTSVSLDDKGIDLNISKNGLRTEPEEFLFRARMIDIDGKQIGYDSIYLPDKLYKAPIAQMGAPSIVGLKKINEVRYSIVLEAQRIAPLVWLDLKPPFVGWFSDNAFTMTQNHRVIFIDIRPEFSQSRSTLELSDITVCSLRNCGDADR